MTPLIANHITSGIVIVACWWLAHSNARAQPPGRAIAAAYALVGFSFLLTAVARGAGLEQSDAISWLFAANKALLGLTLALTIIRRYRHTER